MILDFFVILNSSLVVEKLVVEILFVSVILTGDFFWNSSSRFFLCCGLQHIPLTLLVSLVCKKKSKYGVCFFLVFLIRLKECRYPCISTSKKKNTKKTQVTETHVSMITWCFGLYEH